MSQPKPTCLYPDEKEIAKLVLGTRAKEWPHTAKFLEDKFNLPKVNPLMGGRYWPAVQRFFDLLNGLVRSQSDAGPSVTSVNSRVIIRDTAPDGEETFGAEKDAARRHRRLVRRTS